MHLSLPARALVFAVHAHHEQKRKYTGEPYIVHPIAVADLVRRVTSDEDVIAAAYLHDVIEDTHGSEEVARQAVLDNFGDRVCGLVLELTDVFTKKRYPQWNRQERHKRERERLAGVSPEAQTVKLADIACNCYDMARQNPEFATTYIPEKEAVLQVLTKGAPELQRHAMQTIGEARELLRLAATE